MPEDATDPLGAFVAGAVNAETERPIPLVSTSFEVTIDSGLVIVATKRLLRNDEPNSIEATITFPVPVHATLFALEARIGGRVVKARAQRRAGAREAYEEAIERGKTTILHEEVLRGVHMLSVGHIPPGAEVEVSSCWATTLTIVDGRGCLRIPLTVGDIYGRSGLPDSDDLIHGGPVQSAALTVRCADGALELVGGRLDGGRAEVMLNAPIDLVVGCWEPRDLCGRAADGRDVLLRVEPRPAGDEPLNVALVVDRSGSMGGICCGGATRPTKHEAVVSGLKAIANDLRDSDLVDLWEFNNSPSHVGTAQPSTPGAGTRTKKGTRQRLAALIRRLGEPSGGTEIGRALATATTKSAAGNVLLVTDGKSHALDVQVLAQTGRRVTVVLVGEDSLEANVGHLAALTGGDIFVASGTDLKDVLLAALRSLRRPCHAPARVAGKLRRVEIGRGNAWLCAEWRTSEGAADETILARAVAAVSAGLALPALDAEAAAALAEAEGLVSHLTSLVLVDEAGQTQPSVPSARKIALPTPRTSTQLMAAVRPSLLGPTRMYSLRPRVASVGNPALRSLYLAEDSYARIDLSGLASRIDWEKSPSKLVAGDLSGLDSAVAKVIQLASQDPKVTQLAHRLGIDAVRLILALVARSCAARNRSAMRIARAILGATTLPELRELGIALGLQEDQAAKRADRSQRAARVRR